MGSIWDAVFGINYHYEDGETGEMVEVENTNWLDHIANSMGLSARLSSYEKTSEEETKKRKADDIKKSTNRKLIVLGIIAAICIIYILYKRKK